MQELESVEGGKWTFPSPQPRRLPPPQILMTRGWYLKPFCKEKLHTLSKEEILSNMQKPTML